MKKTLVYVFLFCCASTSVKAQRIIYAKSNSSDRTIDDYAVIGNYDGNILVYKRLQDKTIVSEYNAYMNEVSRNDLDIDPNKMLKTDFIAYPDFSYMVYQYLTENLVFCMAAKLDKDGKMVGKPTQLDYYEVKDQKNKLSNIVPYGVLSSEDKKRIMVLKGGKINDEKYVFKTLLFDENLHSIHNGKSQLPIMDNNHFIDQFQLANDGSLIFLNSEKITTAKPSGKYFLQEKPALNDHFKTDSISLENRTLKDVRLQIDNANNQYVLTSFYYDGTKTNIAGIFHFVWDKKDNRETVNLTIPLTNDTKAMALGENATKTSTFNDFYLQNIVLKKDGSFSITAESMYATTRNSPVISTPTQGFNDQLGINISPILPEGKGFLARDVINQTPAPVEPHTFTPQQAINQIAAENVLVLSFDKTGKLQAETVVKKNQFIDENNGANISYAMVNTGDDLRFVYNSFEKLNARTPTFQFVTATGQTDAPKVFDFDKNVTLMPRYAKQTGLHQLVIPCISHSILSFSKIDF